MMRRSACAWCRSAQVLRPFPRLVRDLSHRLGKKVQLVTRGETTESDKAIVDRLYEPLLHIVRNALDHGIETPDARRRRRQAGDRLDHHRGVAGR